MTIDIMSFIRAVPDFPKPGIMFRDITPLLANPRAFRKAAELQMEILENNKIKFETVVGIESRGFIFGSIIADQNFAGFVPARKPGKLPAKSISRNYGLEYGTNTLSIHFDAIQPGQKVVLVDDLLASGGTAQATAEMIQELGGEVVCCLFLIELDGLPGRKKLETTGLRVESVLHYPA